MKPEREMASWVARRATVGVLAAICLTGCGEPDKAPGSQALPPDHWDVVVLTDSYGWGVGEAYVERIRATHEVEVELHDFAVGGLCAADALKALRGDSVGYGGRLDGLPGAIAQAEIVVMQVNGTCSIPVDSLGNMFRPPYGCVPAGETTFDLFRSRLSGIYAEIKRIRGEAPIRIRTFDAYVATPEGWREAGTFETCRRNTELYNRVIHQVAAGHEVPLAEVRLAFNGPDFEEDPIRKGLIGEDGIHTNPDGQALIGRLLHRLGDLDIYRGEAFEKAVDLQVRFLKSRVPLASDGDGHLP